VRSRVRFPDIRESLGQALESTSPLATQQLWVPGAQIPSGIDSCLHSSPNLAGGKVKSAEHVYVCETLNTSTLLYIVGGTDVPSIVCESAGDRTMPNTYLSVSLFHRLSARHPPNNIVATSTPVSRCRSINVTENFKNRPALQRFHIFLNCDDTSVLASVTSADV
jgi:hypothetical protein